MCWTGDVVGGYKTLSMGSFIVSSSALYWTIFILSLVVLFALMCFKNSYPINYVLLSLWTVAMSTSVATACVATLCDPLVQTPSGGISPASLAPAQSHLYQGAVLCAVGTEQVQNQPQAQKSRISNRCKGKSS